MNRWCFIPKNSVGRIFSSTRAELFCSTRCRRWPRANRGIPVIVLLLGPFAWGDDGLRVPSVATGTVTRDNAGTTVHYPFGKVEIPRESVGKEQTEQVLLGKLHAKTQGSFRLSYVLGREGGLIVARKVQVRVENKEEYLSPATPKLREHEAMHRRINEAEALRIQQVLESFQTGEKNAAKAEEQLKAAFRKQIVAVKKLHAQWDENHVFVQNSNDNEKTNRDSPVASGPPSTVCGTEFPRPCGRKRSCK